MTLQDTLEEWGWARRNRRSGGETVIGPDESLPPTDLVIADLRDYSGTASINEVTHFLDTPNSQHNRSRIIKNGDREATLPTFNLGKFLKIAKGRINPSEALWLQEKSMYKNIALIGPPESGKTQGFIIPGIKAAIDTGLSNIVIDVKGDLIDRIGNYAEQKGVRVIYWSVLPENADRSHSINLLDNVNSLQEAKILAKTLYGDTSNLGQNQRYADRDVSWIAQWIILIKNIFGNAANLKHIYQIAENPVEKLAALVEVCQDIEIANSIRSQLRLIQNDRSSDQAFTWGIQDAVSFFAWDNFQQVTGHSDILLRDIQQCPTLIVIGAELSLREVSKKISSAIIDVIMTIFYERLSENRNNLGIVFWIDEFPRIQNNIDINEFSSVARSGRGGIVIAAKSLEQINPDYREQVMENFDTVILCRGVGNSSAEWLGNRLGFRSQTTRSRRYHEPTPDIPTPWFRPERERYETQRESQPVLSPRETQYPIGDRYTAVVHCRSASRKPFLVDYERNLDTYSRWQSQSRIMWGNNMQEQGTISTSSIDRQINWLDDTSGQRAISASIEHQINWLDDNISDAQIIDVSSINWLD
jgi:hypothetical protein